MIGKTVSHYEIIEKLGKGGMGEVFLAEDTRLHRRVALKFLPTHLTEDREARSRFEREARAAAALNHPNIVTIHEINEHDGQVYIAMEHVDGVTLHEKLAGGRAFSPAEAADIVTQACDGLEKAHAADIVHRDLKPENIMVDTDGRVKILDFGLAKLQGVTRLTRESSTPGTIYYMSPEQARGGDVDARTDVWSIGVILYEMLTGRAPFRGEFEQAVVYSIINEEPEPVASLRPDTPPALAAAVTGALMKDPDERYPGVAAIRKTIGDVRSTTSPASVPEKSSGSKRARIAAVALIGLVAAFVAVTYFLSKKESPDYSPPVHRQLTFTGECRDAVLSRDGDYLAYTSSQGDGSGLFTRDLRTGSSICVYTAPRCWVFDWSPDGDWILFSSFADDTTMGTFVVPRLGGNTRRIHDRPWPFTAWSPGGRKLAHIGYGTRILEIIDLDNSETQTYDLDPAIGDVVSLDWSGTRNELLLQADSKDSHVFWAMRPDGSNRRIVWQSEFGTQAPLSDPSWSVDGNAIYYFRFSLRGQELWELMKLRLDKSGEVTGAPEVVLPSMQISGGITTSGDGKSLAYIRQTKVANLWRIDISDGEAGRTATKTRLTSSTTWKSRAQISPDGTRIVFAMSEGEASNIYTLPFDARTEQTSPPAPQQLTFFKSLNGLPVWSPDGREIVFVSAQSGKPQLWRMGSEGQSPKPIEGTYSNYLDSDQISWAPGRKILYRTYGIRNFMVLDPETGEQHPLVDDEEVGYIFAPCWSPDGDKVVFFWNREEQATPSMDIWMLSLDDNKRKIIADGVYQPITWSENGDWIYAEYYRPGPLMGLYRIPVAGGEPERFAEFPFEDIRYDMVSITPDGRKAVYTEVTTTRDVWMVENFDPAVR
jgi:serine/threonine protein kinase